MMKKMTLDFMGIWIKLSQMISDKFNSFGGSYGSVIRGSLSSKMEFWKDVTMFQSIVILIVRLLYCFIVFKVMYAFVNSLSKKNIKNVEFSLKKKNIFIRMLGLIFISAGFLIYLYNIYSRYNNQSNNINYHPVSYKMLLVKNNDKDKEEKYENYGIGKENSGYDKFWGEKIPNFKGENYDYIGKLHFNGLEINEETN